MQVNDVIEELGKIIGIQSLHINEYGVIHLTIQNIGDLFVDERMSGTENHSIFVYLLRVYEFISAQLYERALMLCDYRHSYSFIVNPVLRKDQALGFAIKHRPGTFNIQILRESIDILKDVQDKLENGANG